MPGFFILKKNSGTLHTGVFNLLTSYPYIVPGASV